MENDKTPLTREEFKKEFLLTIKAFNEFPSEAGLQQDIERLWEWIEQYAEQAKIEAKTEVLEEMDNLVDSHHSTIIAEKIDQLKK